MPLYAYAFWLRCHPVHPAFHLRHFYTDSESQTVWTPSQFKAVMKKVFYVFDVEWQTLITAESGLLVQFVEDFTRRQLFFFDATSEA